MGTAGGINAVARHPSCPDHGCVPPFAANWAQDRGAAFDQHDAQRFRAGLAQARLLPAWEQDKLRNVLALLFGDAAAGPDRP